MKVLLVGDTTVAAASLVVALRAEGYVVTNAATALRGIRQAAEHDYDVVIVDLMVPGPGDYDVVKELRHRGVRTPVLILTASGDEHDQAEALNLGADDYLIRPFSFVVLMARLRALARRARPRPTSVVSAGDLTLDPNRHLVTRGGIPIDLSAREFGLLEYLLRSAGVVRTKTQILRSVWGENFVGPVNVVEVYVGYLRRKIDIPFGTHSIETVRGLGYRLQTPSLASSTADR